MFGLAYLEGHRARPRHAVPGWMSFAHHALMYFALLSFLFVPHGKANHDAVRNTRTLSYQVFFFFGTFQTFYLRLKDYEDEDQPGFAGTYANP
jgi:hypothetical protein